MNFYNDCANNLTLQQGSFHNVLKSITMEIRFFTFILHSAFPFVHVSMNNFAM